MPRKRSNNQILKGESMNKFLFLFIATLFFSVGCLHNQPSPGCQIQSFVSQSAATVIAPALECSHPEAIQQDVFDLIQPIGICKANGEGLVGHLVCPQVGSAVIGFIKGKIPVAWGCKATAAGSKLEDLIVGSCEGVIPFGVAASKKK